MGSAKYLLKKIQLGRGTVNEANVGVKSQMETKFFRQTRKWNRIVHVNVMLDNEYILLDKGCRVICPRSTAIV